MNWRGEAVPRAPPLPPTSARGCLPPRVPEGGGEWKIESGRLERYDKLRFIGVLSGEGGQHATRRVVELSLYALRFVVDEEVAIRTHATGISWILYCGIRILLQRNNVFKRREVLDRMPSSSTANAVPLPRWGRRNRPIN